MAGLIPQASRVRLDLTDRKDLKETKVLKEIRDHLGLKAIKALKGPREILVNPSQPLLLCHLRCPW